MKEGEEVPQPGVLASTVADKELYQALVRQVIHGSMKEVNALLTPSFLFVCAPVLSPTASRCHPFQPKMGNLGPIFLAGLHGGTLGGFVAAVFLPVP